MTHALIISGEIYYVELPEKPKTCSGWIRGQICTHIKFNNKSCVCEREAKEYESACKLALEQKVKFADQEKIRQRLYLMTGFNENLRENHFYPLDVGMRIEDQWWCVNDWVAIPDIHAEWILKNEHVSKRKVAIIEE